MILVPQKGGYTGSPSVRLFVDTLSVGRTSEHKDTAVLYVGGEVGDRMILSISKRSPVRQFSKSLDFLLLSLDAAARIRVSPLHKGGKAQD